MKQCHADITLNGVSLSVDFDYFPPRKGARDSLGGIAGAGPPLEPDDPAEYSITSITTSENIMDLLTTRQLDEIQWRIEEGE